MDSSVLRKYARLIARVGANVQPGQDVIISAFLDQPEFIQMVVEECYEAGAEKVDVEWNFLPLKKVHNKYQTAETLGTVEPWEIERLRRRVENPPVTISLEGLEPNAYDGIDEDKDLQRRKLRSKITKPFADAMENRHQWCVAAVPNVTWARHIYPELSVQEAMDTLWQIILDACRVWDDPAAEWAKHNTALKKHCDKLNSLGIEKLHFTSSNGTDFTVGMMKRGRFTGGSAKTLSGIPFQPNMPSEECFVSPKKGAAEGIVYGTKPLYHGKVIENFWIKFEDGKAVEWSAEKNESSLADIIQTDEGSAYLGEVALVPYSSPISKINKLFYRTLFDENASCHLALGCGYSDTIEGYENMTLAECQKLGLNDSMVHCDFMIGAEDTDIDAICADGSIIPIFRRGEWAI